MSVNEIKPLDLEIYQEHSVNIFLAGSIENGKADDWQKDIVEYIKNFFSEFNVNIFNPRRDDWDSGWEQSIKNKNFKDQVYWEMDHLDSSDIIFFNILGDTLSPITLLELGYECKSTNKVIIINCEEQFWRKGNVEVVAERNNLPLFTNLDSAKHYLKFKLYEALTSSKRGDKK